MDPERSHPHGHAHPAPVGPGALRARGRRLTPQRALIWNVLVAEPDSHVSADEVAARVRAALPQVSPSTIYRTLDLLVEEGLVLRTHLQADRVFYESAHDHPHHHVVCDSCGAVVHVHDEVFGELEERVRAASGYTVVPQEITLRGRCAACRDAAAG